MLDKLSLGLILFGMLLGGVAWYVDSVSLDRDLAPPAVVCIGLGVFLMAQYGWRTGRIRSRSGYVRRDEHPVLFWFMYGICLAGGLTMVVAGLGKVSGII